MPSTPRLRLPTLSINISPRVAKRRGVPATIAAAKNIDYSVHFASPTFLSILNLIKNSLPSTKNNIIACKISAVAPGIP